MHLLLDINLVLLSVVSSLYMYMLYHKRYCITTSGLCVNAVDGYWAGSYCNIDRGDSRDTRSENRSHFFNFGGLFFPNEAGRNCLYGSFMDRINKLGERK